MRCQIEKSEADEVHKLAARIAQSRALNVKEVTVSAEEMRYIIRALALVRCIECN